MYLKLAMSEPACHKDPSVLPVDCELTLNTPYALISSAISFYIPAMIILGTNCRVFLIARLQQKQIRKTNLQMSVSVKTSETCSDSKKSLRKIKSDPGEDKRDPNKRSFRGRQILSKIGVPKPHLKKNQKATITIGIIIR